MKTWDAEAALMTEWEEAAESICQKKKGSDTYGILGNSLCQWMEDKERNGRKKKKAYSKELKKSLGCAGGGGRKEREACESLGDMRGHDNPVLKDGRKEGKACGSGRKSAASDIPPLFKCADRLLEKAKIICVENRLYYFKGLYYEALDQTKLVQLYRDKVDRNLHRAKNIKSFYDLYGYLLTDSRIQIQPDFERLSNLAVLKNGVYNLKKGILKPPDPSVVAFSYVNASYTEGMECPRFEKFLRDVTGNNGILIERLWKSLGYMLIQSLEAKVFFVMGCAPNSGKSLFGKFIMSLYEQHVSSVALSDFNGEFSMGSLVGAAVNISLDLPASRLSASAVSKLKMLTGGDLVTINEKYVPQFKYQNRAKFVFASNHPIQLAGDDEAFWQRLIFLPFDYSIRKPDQDTDLLKKLLKEKDAVVSTALQYARELVQEKYAFPTTEEIERQVRKWRGIEIDTINDFLMERCQIEATQKGETMERMHEAYEAFCREKGEKAQTWKELKDYLENRIGLQHTKSRFGGDGNPKSAFVGISLHPQGSN